MGALGSVLWLGFKRRALTRKTLIQESLVLILLQITFIHTSVLTSFGVYFIFWHSVLSLRDQIRALQTLSPKPALNQQRVHPWLKDYASTAFPYWIISVIGVLTLWKASTAGLISIPISSLVFGGALLLTPPHLFTIGSLHNQLQRRRP